MTSFADARRPFEDVFRASGLRGRGSAWSLKTPDLQWIIQIERPPNGNRIGIDIGLDLRAETASRRPTDCPILLHFENMPFSGDLEVQMALDLDSGLDPEMRRRVLSDAADALVAYLADHMTLERVVAAYLTDDFRAGFIHKDTRALLESEGEIR